MRCLTSKEEDRLNIYGNYDTGKAANLMVVFEKCDPHAGNHVCKDEEEIKNWSTHKYFGILVN